MVSQRGEIKYQQACVVLLSVVLVDVISTSTSCCVKLNLAYLAYSVYFLTDSQLNENLLSGRTIVKTVAKFPGVHFRFCPILKQDDDLIKMCALTLKDMPKAIIYLTFMSISDLEWSF